MRGDSSILAESMKSSQPGGLFRSTRVVMVGRGLGLLAAFGAFVAIAAAYGSSAATDVFFCAYAVPYGFLVLAGAVLPQSFVPVHARVAHAEGPESARRFASASLNTAGIALLALTLAGWAASPGLARLGCPASARFRFRMRGEAMRKARRSGGRMPFAPSAAS